MRFVLAKSESLDIRMRMFGGLLAIKLLYIVAVSMFLPDMWLLWPFQKCVNWHYLPLEMMFFIICGTIFLMSYKRNDTLSVLCTVLFINFYIPANSGLVLSNNDIYYYTLINLYSIILFYALPKVARRDSLESSMEPEILNVFGNQRLMAITRTVTFILCCVIIMFVYSYNGLDFSFQKAMYDTRAVYAGYRAELRGSLLSYILMMFDGVKKWFLPIAFFFALYKRSVIDIALCFLAQLALFTVSMEKSTLMLIPTAAFFAWAYRHTDFSCIGELLIKCFILLFGVIFLESFLFDTTFIFHLLCERLLYIPTYMIKVHYDFFSHHPKMWFTQDVFIVSNFLRRLIGRVYMVARTETISNNMFDGLIPAPNAGAFAEAYAQLGVLGVFVFPWIIAWAAKIVCKSAEWYGQGSAALLMFMFVRGVLSESILESGILVGIFLFVYITYLLQQIYNSKYTVVLRKQQT